MGRRTIDQSPVYTITEIHERLSRYFDMCPLTGMPAEAFADPLDFVVHETWKRRILEDLGSGVGDPVIQTITVLLRKNAELAEKLRTYEETK